MMGLYREINEDGAAQNVLTPDAPFTGGPTEPPAVGSGGSSNPFSEACNLVAVHVSAYMDGELDEDTFNVVDSHLQRCSSCWANLSELIETDRQIQREWQEASPLPSSYAVDQAVDRIMASLPAEPQATPDYARKRMHSRVRWMRFSTGLTCIIALGGLLWSSYRLGYYHGKATAHKPISVSLLSITSFF